MMRVDKTNKYDEGGQNKQGKKAHYDEGGENKAKTHYNYEYEGREMRVWRKRKKTQKKDRE